jgi:hypothetical protein
MRILRLDRCKFEHSFWISFTFPCCIRRCPATAIFLPFVPTFNTPAHPPPHARQPRVLHVLLTPTSLRSTISRIRISQRGVTRHIKHPAGLPFKPRCRCLIVPIIRRQRCGDALSVEGDVAEHVWAWEGWSGC